MSDTIKQRSKIVPIDDGGVPREIIVRRFYWKAAGEFAAALAKFIAETIIPLWPKPAAGETSDFCWADLLPKVPAIIVSSDTLVKQLLTGTTPLKREEIDQLDFVDVLNLAAGALEVNYDAETKNSFAGVVEGIIGAAGFQRPKSGASSTPTSSTPATPPTTSTAAPC